MSRKSVKKHNRGKNQKGGERTGLAMNKDGDSITFQFPTGFPKTNGDYDIVHKYDSQKVINERVLSNLNSLKLWLQDTFPGEERVAKRSFVKYNDPKTAIHCAQNIYIDNKSEFLVLMDWLLNGKD